MIRNKWIAYFIYIILPFVHLLKDNRQQKINGVFYFKKVPQKINRDCFYTGVYLTGYFRRYMIIDSCIINWPPAPVAFH